HSLEKLGLGQPGRFLRRNRADLDLHVGRLGAANRDDGPFDLGRMRDDRGAGTESRVPPRRTSQADAPALMLSRTG
ncbi:MAG TPA: hypothetical protein VJ882_06625, partial [Desulfuromonadales bacterium]|nr:hypothetical protein [Desulfuromonadales bacterium]